MSTNKPIPPPIKLGDHVKEYGSERTLGTVIGYDGTTHVNIHTHEQPPRRLNKNRNTLIITWRSKY